MSRPPRGLDVLDSALQAIVSATTIEQLRQARSVVLPLRYGMSLEQTVKTFGLSKDWTCRLRNQFIAGGAVDNKGKSVRGVRAESTSPLSAKPNYSNRSRSLPVSAAFWWSARSSPNSMSRWGGR